MYILIDYNQRLRANISFPQRNLFLGSKCSYFYWRSMKTKFYYFNKFQDVIVNKSDQDKTICPLPTCRSEFVYRKGMIEHLQVETRALTRCTFYHLESISQLTHSKSVIWNFFSKIYLFKTILFTYFYSRSYTANIFSHICSESKEQRWIDLWRGCITSKHCFLVLPNISRTFDKLFRFWKKIWFLLQLA